MSIFDAQNTLGYAGPSVMTIPSGGGVPAGFLPVPGQPGRYYDGAWTPPPGAEVGSLTGSYLDPAAYKSALEIGIPLQPERFWDVDPSQVNVATSQAWWDSKITGSNVAANAGNTTAIGPAVPVTNDSAEIVAQIQAALSGTTLGFPTVYVVAAAALAIFLMR